jgi:hypothetical protein
LRSYIKIYGPPTHGAIKALEKISVEIPYVCIMNTGIRMRILESTLGVAEKLMLTPLQTYAMVAELAMKHFEASGITLPTDRRISIISSLIESLEEYDFFFEWIARTCATRVRVCARNYYLTFICAGGSVVKRFLSLSPDARR